MRILILCLGFFLTSVAFANNVKVGAEQFDKYQHLLTDKRVGLVVNQTSMVKQQHLLDFLLTNNVNVTTIFAPEHGFRGKADAGATINSGVDNKTGIPIVSIYGSNKSPSQAVLAKLDIIIFDIQDVGARFYTYISSMHYVMQAAADAGVEFLVLDRPNPNIQYVAGPVLESDFRSFVGIYPIPLLHGMTVAELANMAVGEKWLHSKKKLKLHTVAVANYDRATTYSLPIKPSPNLPNDQSISLYPSLCLFEATPISIGRGTAWPFQVIGHNQVPKTEFSFTPAPTSGASSPKLSGNLLYGEDLRHSPISGFDISRLLTWYRYSQQANFEFFKHSNFFDKLAGTDKLRLAIIAGKTQQQIEQTWQPALQAFIQLRKPYLIYP